MIFSGDPLKVPVSDRWRPMRTLADIVGTPPTGEGWHVTGKPWHCPEDFRLIQLGVHKSSDSPTDYDGRLTPLSLGSLWHKVMQADALGKDPVRCVLHADGIPDEDVAKAETLYRAYKLHYPRRGYTLVGAEARLRVAVPMRKVWRVDPKTGKRAQVQPCFSCRLDKLAVLDRRLVNIEHKTTSRYSPSSTMQEWRVDGQVISQAWICSRHPWVKAHGGLYTTYMDLAIKTQEPDFVREPIRVAGSQIKAFEESLIAWNLLREKLEADLGYGRPWPRSWDCAGRYSICQYSDWCHFNAANLYEGLP